MSTTTPRPTPETDAMFTAFNQRLSRPGGGAHFARKLERERNEARNQLKAMREAIREVFNSFADEDSAWLLDDLQTAALAKLKPFLAHE